MYVTAKTSGDNYADTDDSPYIYLRLQNSAVASAQFPDNPGDDMEKNKVDRWEIRINYFHFSGCVRRSEISSVYLRPGGTDGWKIDWIKTEVSTSSGYQGLTDDSLDQWLDYDENPSDREIELTIRNYQ